MVRHVTQGQAAGAVGASELVYRLATKRPLGESIYIRKSLKLSFIFSFILLYLNYSLLGPFCLCS